MDTENKPCNELANYTHTVPKNPLGYFAMHCLDNQPLPPDVALKMVAGPLTGMQPKLTDELAGKNDGCAALKSEH
jgi:hypothetical protein